MARALFLDRSNGETTAAVRTVGDDDLPEGDLLVDIHYSDLNYKDALAVTGEGKIIRGDFPFVPGIDLVGTVVTSHVDRFAAGDVVIGTGGQLGERYWGGLAERQCIPADYLVELPDGLDPKQAMTIGTAGYTAMLAVMALEEHGVEPSGGKVIVTGATGGAGSIAVALLAQLGHDVVASTGSADAHDYLRALGASRIIDRQAFSEGPERPMASAKWAAAVDAVGGATLATLLSQMARHAAIAAFGNAGGHELHTTVFPFILRGVSLLGIDSNTCPVPRREVAWRRLAELMTSDVLDRVTDRVIGLDAVPQACRDVLAGRTRGRVVVDVSA